MGNCIRYHPVTIERGGNHQVLITILFFERLAPVPGCLLYGFIFVHRAGALCCCWGPFRANSWNGFSLESASMSQKSIEFSVSCELRPTSNSDLVCDNKSSEEPGEKSWFYSQDAVIRCHHQPQRGKSNSTGHSPRDHRIEEGASSPEAGTSLYYPEKRFGEKVYSCTFRDWPRYWLEGLSPDPGLLLHGFIFVHRAGALCCCFRPFQGELLNWVKIHVEKKRLMTKSDKKLLL